MAFETCVACQSKDLKNLGVIEGYIQGGQYAVISCEACGTHYADPHASYDEVYEWIYKNRRVAPGYARYSQFAEAVLDTRDPLTYLGRQEDMYYAVATEIHRNVPKGGSVLDVGCGLGYLTYSLRKAGYISTGLDISEEAIVNARRAYGDFFMREDFFNLDYSTKYDAICMLELIEHVADPHAYIAQAKKLLKKGGVLIVTTPNRSWFSKSDIWNTDLPPVHITWFSEKGMHTLFAQHGLEAHFFDYSRYNVLYGTLRKPLPAHGVRTPIFSQQGDLLTTPYAKSSARIKAERLGVYSLLKLGMNSLKKIKDYVLALASPRKVSLKQSGTMCVTAKI